MTISFTRFAPIIISLLSLAAPASSATLVHFSIAGEHSAEFDIREQPAPASFVAGSSFLLTGVHGTFEGSTGTTAIRFFNDALGGGLEIVGDFIGHYSQLYSGSEGKPTIFSGDFQLIDSTTGGNSGVVIFENGTVGGVPEPASWMMLIAGFGLIGTGLRRRMAIA